jgi:hypothetical protein
MRRMMVVILLACMMPGSAFAQDKPYAAVNWLGSYVISSGSEANPHPVFQPEAGIVFDNGFDMSVWASLPASMNHVDENKATEIDLFLGYTLGPFRIGAEYDFLAPTDDLHNDSFEVNAQIGNGFDFGRLTVSPVFRIDYHMPVSGPHNRNTTGLYLFPSIGFSYRADAWTFSIGNKFIGDLGGYGADKALIAKITPNVGYQLAKGLSANAGVDMYFPIAKSGRDPRREHYIPKIGVTFSF